MSAGVHRFVSKVGFWLGQPPPEEVCRDWTCATKLAASRVESQLRRREKVRPGAHANENAIVVWTWMLQPGKAEIAGRDVHTVLTKSRL
jgi:hypothetical protein